MRWSGFFICFFLIISQGVLTGAIRKKHDPILETQTDPIALKKKLEEIKDGEKGAPAPSFKFYEKAEFQTKSPVGTEPKEFIGLWEDRVPEKGDTLPEDTSDGSFGGEDSWWSESWEEPEKASWDQGW